MVGVDIVIQKNTHTLNATSQDHGTRLDVCITKHFGSFSRSYVKRLADLGYIFINGKQAKAGMLIKQGDEICIQEPNFSVEHELSKGQQEIVSSLSVKIIYQHKDFLVIDKPAGLMVHKPSSYSQEVTLVDWLLYCFPKVAQIGPLVRPGIVHRLDKDTSGIMLVALSSHAHRTLSDMFRYRTISKEYIALVRGHPDRSGVIDGPIGRDPIKRNQMAVNGLNARDARTQFQVVQYFQRTTLINLLPLTGRTHQLRVHCAFIGHTIVGDTVYGAASKEIGRQALHAQRLSFQYNDQSFSFVAELPQDFERLISLQKTI